MARRFADAGVRVSSARPGVGIDLARAVFLIEEKEEIARNRIIKEFDGSAIQVLNGRFGPYISDGKLNGKIPKDREPASLTLEDVIQLMEETGKPARKGFGAKKGAAKKAAESRPKAAKKAAARTAPAKAPAKKAAKKAPAKKAVAKKAPVKKAAAKKAPARKPGTLYDHPEPAKPLLKQATLAPGAKRVVRKAKDEAPF